MVAANGESVPHFGPNTEILFRLTDGKAYYLAAMSRDGSGRRKVFPDRVIDMNGMSPDRRLISLVVANPPIGPHGAVYSLDGGPAQRICDVPCSVAWSPDGRYMYMAIAPAYRRTAVIPIPPGEPLPQLPPAAVHDPAEWAKVPGVKIVEHENISPGPNPSTYAYIKPSVHANLFRIPLH
jgi:hypothetical protein